MKLSAGRIWASVGIAVAVGALVIGGMAFADHGSGPSTPPGVLVDDHGSAPTATHSEGPDDHGQDATEGADDSGDQAGTGVDRDDNHGGPATCASATDCRGAGHPED